MGKITTDMTDKERYKLLKGRDVTLGEARVAAPLEGTLEELERATLKEAQPLLKKLADEFGVIGDYKNSDIELRFQFSRGGLAESIQKQDGSYGDFGKMLSCFGQVVDGAVGIKAQDNRYGADENIKGVYVLAGGFSDNGRVVPVKLVVKELQEGRKNTLHVAVTRGKKNETNVHGVAAASALASVVPPLVSKISIRQLIKNINTLDGDFLKYFPDKFLTNKQRKSAQTARDTEAQYIAQKQAGKARRAAFGKTSARVPPPPTSDTQKPAVPTSSAKLEAVKTKQNTNNKSHRQKRL